MLNYMGPISASLDGAGKAELNCISLIQLAKGEEFNGSISRRFLLKQSPSLAKPAKVSHQDKAFVLSHKSDAPQNILGDLRQQTGCTLTPAKSCQVLDQLEPRTSFSPLRTPITSKSSIKYLRAYRSRFSSN